MPWQRVRHIGNCRITRQGNSTSATPARATRARAHVAADLRHGHHHVDEHISAPRRSPEKRTLLGRLGFGDNTNTRSELIQQSSPEPPRVSRRAPGARTVLSQHDKTREQHKSESGKTTPPSAQSPTSRGGHEMHGQQRFRERRLTTSPYPRHDGHDSRIDPVKT